MVLGPARVTFFTPGHVNDLRASPAGQGHTKEGNGQGGAWGERADGRGQEDPGDRVAQATGADHAPSLRQGPRALLLPLGLARASSLCSILF